MSSSMRSVTASAISNIQFSKQDEREYRLAATDCLAEALGIYEDFLYVRNRELDKTHWKLVKQKEHVQVYKDRRCDQQSSTTDNSQQQFAKSHGPGARVKPELGPAAAMAENTSIPVMVAVASLQGTLEDVMYGSFVDDTPSLRRRSAYFNDQSEECSVLHTIETPTENDPFRYFGVVWVLRNFPGLNAVMRRRDLLMTLKTGYSQTSKGEKIGYVVWHSVEHRDLPELQQHQIIRGKVSIVGVYRQLKDNIIDMFQQVVVLPGGQAPSFVIVADSANTMISMGKPIACAHKKKLYWRMCRNAQKLLLSETGGPLLSSPSSSTSSSSATASFIANMRRNKQKRAQEAAQNCGTCQKSLSKLFSGGGSYCQICQQMMCSRCRVTKNLVIDASDKKVVWRPFDFCLGCVLKTRDLPAVRVHEDEQHQRLRD